MGLTFRLLYGLLIMGHARLLCGLASQGRPHCRMDRKSGHGSMPVGEQAPRYLIRDGTGPFSLSPDFDQCQASKLDQPGSGAAPCSWFLRIRGLP